MNLQSILLPTKPKKKNLDLDASQINQRELCSESIIAGGVRLSKLSPVECPNCNRPLSSHFQKKLPLSTNTFFRIQISHSIPFSVENPNHPWKQPWTSGACYIIDPVSILFFLPAKLLTLSLFSIVLMDIF
jgi:hypothetical protein